MWRGPTLPKLITVIPSNRDLHNPSKSLQNRYGTQKDEGVFLSESFEFSILKWLKMNRKMVQ